MKKLFLFFGFSVALIDAGNACIGVKCGPDGPCPACAKDGASAAAAKWTGPGASCKNTGISYPCCYASFDCENAKRVCRVKINIDTNAIEKNKTSCREK